MQTLITPDKRTEISRRYRRPNMTFLDGYLEGHLMHAERVAGLPGGIEYVISDDVVENAAEACIRFQVGADYYLTHWRKNQTCNARNAWHRAGIAFAELQTHCMDHVHVGFIADEHQYFYGGALNTLAVEVFEPYSFVIRCGEIAEEIFRD